MTKRYIISDLHIGDGREPKSSRNNFMYKKKYEKFRAFLHQVNKERAGLFILGDLFDFWLADIDGVIHHNWDFLDALADIDNLVYIPGNHDSDFAGFYAPESTRRSFLNHPFFRDPERVKLTHEHTVAGTRFVFRHGHEKDAFNDAPYPVTGRMVTILAGLVEDQMSRYVDYDDGQTLPVEPALTALGDVVLWLLGPLMQALESVKAKRDAGQAKFDMAQENPVCGSARTALDKARAAGMRDYEDSLLLQNDVLNALFEHLADSMGGPSPDFDAASADANAPMRDWLKKHLIAVFREWVDKHGKCGDRIAPHLHTMYHDYWNNLPDKHNAVMVVGHTHLPGICRDKPNGSDRIWYYNSGSWSDLDHDVLTLDEAGVIRYFTYTENGLEPTEPKDFTDFLTP